MENQGSVNPTSTTDYDDMGDLVYYDDDDIDGGGGEKSTERALAKEDILREEPDFSSIKSNEAIPDYGPCMECDTSILTEDPPRSLMLNVCGDMIHRTCAKNPDKRGVLHCSCSVADSSDPLLPQPTQFNKCAKCSIDISAEPPEPIVLLTCKHVVHFECIDNNKRKLCPGPYKKGLYCIRTVFVHHHTVYMLISYFF
ncbi:hypothetical protein C1645_744613 [Glomus cerebriforme]|uniref:RING-type domain-containing protein n=1 Tax=Glomus cerebriforme TaxID=658196 RepID=A0A397S5P2_9GLOM|nr:hypothetical protein C1645_744613 [Glomus cerebriforme]